MIWNVCTKPGEPVIVVPEGEVVPDGYVVEAQTANPDYLTAYAPVVPDEVTMRQARQSLLRAGLLDEVEAVVSLADRSIQIDWEYGQTVRRDWPALEVVKGMVGLTDQQIDELFILAESL